MREPSTVNETLKEYGRGIIGGLIVSLPLVYTMEVWWAGFISSPWYLISCIIVTYLLLLGYNRYAGMRADTSFADLCWDSVEEIALAFVVSFLFLWLLGRINLQMSSDEILGKVIIESMIVAIGISVGTAQLGQNNDEQSGMDEDQPDTPTNYLSIIILSICGATLFASAVAPTDEILMIAAASTELHQLLLVILSMVLCSVILYFSEFKGSNARSSSHGQIVRTIIISYAIALIVAFLLLLFFGRISDNGLEIIIAQVIVLGVPAAIGASAGRLLISPQS